MALKLPFLHKKRYAIPLLSVAIAAIVVLALLPSIPQVQSTAQSYTAKHPTISKLAPAVFQPPNLGFPTTGNWLIIPAASIKMPIVEGSSIDVLVQNVGVWHQTGDAAHNYVIAGHRLQYFRSVNQSLYHLNILKPADEGVYLDMQGKVQQYQVITSMVVAPTDVAILNPTSAPVLTIYTCNDFNNQSRLVVTAIPVAN